MSIPTDVIRKHRNCKHCGAGYEKNKGYAWHKDRWGRIGHYCHFCYNAIQYAEKTLFVERKQILNNRRWGI